MINIDQFHEMEIRIGKILSAEKVPETDKLLRLSVDFAEENPRQIVSGISAYFPDPAALAGRHVAFVANLEPRIIKGLESQGMILAAHAEGAFALMEVPDSIPAGTRIG
jgi:methionyl-tRNA synthetase